MTKSNSTSSAQTIAQEIWECTGQDLDRALDLRDEMAADPDTLHRGRIWAQIEDHIWDLAKAS